jgi:hypothetical protein
MKPLLLCVGLAALTVLLLQPPHVWSQAAPPQGLQPFVAGIVISGRVIAGGVPLTSGTWGTDYITVSHALSVGASYAVIRDGLPFAETKPVAACSSQAHGIDVLILRAAPHKTSPVVEWGDPTELKSGDELIAFVRREIHPEPIKLKFLHTNLLEWSKQGRDSWSSQWHNTMVAQGTAKPGVSGSPWTLNGRVYGLFKGQVRLPNHPTWYPVAETATRVQQCLQQLGYEHLIPKE